MPRNTAGRVTAATAQVAGVGTSASDAAPVRSEGRLRRKQSRRREALSMSGLAGDRASLTVAGQNPSLRCLPECDGESLSGGLFAAVEALGVATEQDLHTVAGPLGDLRRRNSAVEPG